MKINTLRNPLFILALVSGFAVAGCGDDDNAEPSTTTIEDEDASASDDTDEPTDESDEGDASDTTTESDTESDTTTGTDTTEAADASDTGGGGEDASDTSGDTDEDAGAGDDDAGTETSEDAGSDAGPVVEECVENDDACFSCPSTPEQFLTQCEVPGTQCSAFDNASRLGLYVEGQPLPTP